MDESAATLSRREILREPVTSGAFGVVEKPLSTWERVGNLGYVRKLVMLVALALIWEAYARWLNNPLLFPTFSSTFEAFIQGLFGGDVGCRGNSGVSDLICFASKWLTPCA